MEKLIEYLNMESCEVDDHDIKLLVDINRYDISIQHGRDHNCGCARSREMAAYSDEKELYNKIIVGILLTHFVKCVDLTPLFLFIIFCEFN